MSRVDRLLDEARQRDLTKEDLEDLGEREMMYLSIMLEAAHLHEHAEMRDDHSAQRTLTIPLNDDGTETGSYTTPVTSRVTIDERPWGKADEAESKVGRGVPVWQPITDEQALVSGERYTKTFGENHAGQDMPREAWDRSGGRNDAVPDMKRMTERVRGRAKATVGDADPELRDAVMKDIGSLTGATPALREAYRLAIHDRTDIGKPWADVEQEAWDEVQGIANDVDGEHAAAEALLRDAPPIVKKSIQAAFDYYATLQEIQRIHPMSPEDEQRLVDAIRSATPSRSDDPSEDASEDDAEAVLRALGHTRPDGAGAERLRWLREQNRTEEQPFRHPVDKAVDALKQGWNQAGAPLTGQDITDAVQGMQDDGSRLTAKQWFDSKREERERLAAQPAPKYDGMYRWARDPEAAERIAEEARQREEKTDD